MSLRRSLAPVAAAVVALVAGRAGAITLEDPANYAVKNTWAGNTLGLPSPLGALMFSADGGTLYVVGASETLTHAVYAVGVTRDPGTHEVTDLTGPATPVFSGDATTRGLDAGLEFGPAGTLFYTYWPANRLGQRPGGFGGVETLFDMSTVGVPSSIAGLAFSPHITDPMTGFGQLHVSSWSGANLYAVPLVPAGGGLFTPQTATLFVTLPQQGTGGIQYVPSGPLAGNLMYVNYSFAEIRVLTVEPATGLPVDVNTGQPTLGTTTPEDARFASAVGGAWGLEFDPRTNDFFVATWNGNPSNTIIQIGGAGFPPPDTTTTTSSTSTTSVTAPLPTTTTTSSSTSTTAPPAGCTPGATLASVNCRLAALIATIQASGLEAAMQDRLVRRLAKAKERKEKAEEKLAAGQTRPASNNLKQSVRQLIQFDHVLRTRAGRRNVPELERSDWLLESAGMKADLRRVRDGLRT